MACSHRPAPVRSQAQIPEASASAHPSYTSLDNLAHLPHAIPIAVDAFRFGMEECVSVMQIRF